MKLLGFFQQPLPVAALLGLGRGQECSLDMDKNKSMFLFISMKTSFRFSLLLYRVLMPRVCVCVSMHSRRAATELSVHLCNNNPLKLSKTTQRASKKIKI